MSTDYRPGTCNIGRPERRLRYRVGAVGFAAAAALAVAAVGLSWPRWALLATGLPLFAGFVGYYQGREGFCVRYAYEGVYNLGERLGDRDAVEDGDDALEDRRHARALMGRAALAALAVAGAVYLVGVLLHPA